jgi:hypothetical protein
MHPRKALAWLTVAAIGIPVLGWTREAGAGARADNLPPSISITVPLDGTTLSGLVEVSGIATDNAAVERVDLSLDGAIFASVRRISNWSVALDTKAYPDGPHILVAKARDSSGNKASTSVAITFKQVGPTPPRHRMYAFYYMWWNTAHWQTELGSRYPYDAFPLPLPATLDEAGCNPLSLYEGNHLVDVPTTLYSQDDPGVIESHVRQAAGAGLAGFLANWRGTGLAGQTTRDTAYSRRLAELVRAVNEVNAEGIPFKLWLNYKASHQPTLEQVLNDWEYLEKQYAGDPALDRYYSDRPIIVWNRTQDYPTAWLKTVSGRFRSTFFIVGSESWKSWTSERAQYLDGNTYYWSSQNPYSNPASFSQLKKLADMVRSSGPNPDGSKKLWFSPLAPGYNHILGGGSSCVPRNGGQTMTDLFKGNSASDPDGWAFISWNEIEEATHVEPLQRWGSFYLDLLSSIIEAD